MLGGVALHVLVEWEGHAGGEQLRALGRHVTTSGGVPAATRVRIFAK